MMTTISGLFDSMGDAQSAAKELMDRGISRDSISMVARDSRGESAYEHEVGAAPAAGAVVGGAVGLLVGAGLLAIPGIGPVLAIGPLAAAIGSTAAAVGATALGAGIGAGIGGLAGGLMSLGVPAEDAHTYAEGVRRGGTLLTVSVDSAIAERADVDSVLRHYGATDMHQRSADWRADGWSPGVRTGDVGADSEEAWRESRKVGTAAGPVGTVIGAGERPMPAGPYRGGNADDADISSPRDLSSPHMGGNVDQYDQDFRTHYQSLALVGRRPYDYYAPAYRFGYDMGVDPRSSSGTWDTVEPKLRRDWEQHDPNSWAELKAAVRYAWEKARGLR